MILLALLLLALAIAGGVAINPLVFLLVLVAIVLIVHEPRGPRPLL